MAGVGGDWFHTGRPEASTISGYRKKGNGTGAAGAAGAASAAAGAAGAVPKFTFGAVAAAGSALNGIIGFAPWISLAPIASGKVRIVVLYCCTALL